MNPSDPIPAATLILFREQAGLLPEHLMIERSAVMAFAAGALVFPGGRVDPGDQTLALALRPDGDQADMAARVAAIRETIEETGLAVGVTPIPPAGHIAALRHGLAAGQEFAMLLDEHGYSLDLDALVPFARWQPNMRETRNFDTRFYIAAAGADGVAHADGGESVHALWGSAADILAEARAGRHRLIFPTRRNLERLAMLPSFEAARAHAALYPVTAITPFIDRRDDGDWLRIPDGFGYPVTEEPVNTALRG